MPPDDGQNRDLRGGPGQEWQERAPWGACYSSSGLTALLSEFPHVCGASWAENNIPGFYHARGSLFRGEDRTITLLHILCTVSPTMIWVKSDQRSTKDYVSHRDGDGPRETQWKWNDQGTRQKEPIASLPYYRQPRRLDVVLPLEGFTESVVTGHSGI